MIAVEIVGTPGRFDFDVFIGAVLFIPIIWRMELHRDRKHMRLKRYPNRSLEGTRIVSILQYAAIHTHMVIMHTKDEKDPSILLPTTSCAVLPRTLHASRNRLYKANAAPTCTGALRTILLLRGHCLCRMICTFWALSDRCDSPDWTSTPDEQRNARRQHASSL